MLHPRKKYHSCLCVCYYEGTSKQVARHLPHACKESNQRIDKFSASNSFIKRHAPPSALLKLCTQQCDTKQNEGQPSSQTATKFTLKQNLKESDQPTQLNSEEYLRLQSSDDRLHSSDASTRRLNLLRSGVCSISAIDPADCFAT